MIKGLWSGLTNCERCIYDRACGFSCCNKKPEACLDDQSDTEALDTTSEGYTNLHMFDNILPDYDIVSSPDPTSSVSIVQVPKKPRWIDKDNT